MVLEYNLTTIWKDKRKKFHSEILAIAVSIGAWERSGRQDPSYSEWVDAKELDESLRESVSMSNLSIITCELSVWCKYSCATMPVLLFLSFLFNMVDYIMEVFPSLNAGSSSSRTQQSLPGEIHAPHSLHYRSSNNFAITYGN